MALIVKLYVPAGVLPEGPLGPPEQPAIASSTSIAIGTAIRTRRFLPAVSASSINPSPAANHKPGIPRSRSQGSGPRGVPQLQKVFKVIAVTVLAPGESVAVVGDTEQVIDGCELVHPSATVPVNPPVPAKVRKKIAVSPGFTVRVVDVPGCTVRLNVLLEPVPVSGTECGLPVALSTIVIAPERAPAAVGLKVTEMVQVPFAAMGEAVTQVVVSAKSPLAVTEVTVKAALPVFVSVTVCAGEVAPIGRLANVRLVGDKLTAGPVGGDPAPVPDSVTK